MKSDKLGTKWKWDVHEKGGDIVYGVTVDGRTYRVAKDDDRVHWRADYLGSLGYIWEALTSKRYRTPEQAAKDIVDIHAKWKRSNTGKRIAKDMNKLSKSNKYRYGEDVRELRNDLLGEECADLGACFDDFEDEYLSEASSKKSYADFLGEADARFLTAAIPGIKKVAGSKVSQLQVKKPRSLAWLEYQGEDRGDMGLQMLVSVQPVRDNNVRVMYQVKSAYSGRHDEDVVVKAGVLTPEHIVQKFRQFFGDHGGFGEDTMGEEDAIDDDVVTTLAGQVVASLKWGFDYLPGKSSKDELHFHYKGKGGQKEALDKAEGMLGDVDVETSGTATIGAIGGKGDVEIFVNISKLSMKD